MRVYLNNLVPLLLLLKNSHIKSTINGFFRCFQMKNLTISISQLLLLVMLEKTSFSSGHCKQITFFDKR
ncbi:hypothetical protein AMTRI_Chr11g149830 [Amborella trichopoda]